MPMNPVMPPLFTNPSDLLLKTLLSQVADDTAKTLLATFPQKGDEKVLKQMVETFIRSIALPQANASTETPPPLATLDRLVRSFHHLLDPKQPDVERFFKTLAPELRTVIHYQLKSDHPGVVAYRSQQNFPLVEFLGRMGTDNPASTPLPKGNELFGLAPITEHSKEKEKRKQKSPHLRSGAKEILEMIKEETERVLHALEAFEKENSPETVARLVPDMQVRLQTLRATLNECRQLLRLVE